MGVREREKSIPAGSVIQFCFRSGSVISSLSVITSGSVVGSDIIGGVAENESVHLFTLIIRSPIWTAVFDSQSRPGAQRAGKRVLGLFGVQLSPSFL